MLSKISALWQKWSDVGMRFPYAYDPTTGKPSITLLQFYVSWVVVFCSLFALHFKASLWPATAGCMLWWVLSVIFYRMRRLDKAKIDLDDKSIELESTEKEEA